MQIAKNGLGTTRPNPMVGCIIVVGNKIIGEGFTSPYGGNHAEVNAIKNVQDKTLLEKATLYVTLEPCSHYGKTPPCTDLIIEHKIRNVVIGCMDDNPKVAGKGIKKLMEAGTNVIVGVLEKECAEYHKRFLTYHNKKRPFIILKWAECQNGFIAPKTKNEQKPVWITNAHSRQLVHKWRSEEQAILVGTSTALADNPSLTVRDWTGTNPTRIVIDRHKKLSKSLSIYNNAASTITVDNSNCDFNLPLAKQICDILFKNSINSVIIEGGTKTLQTFIQEDMWDEARVFTGVACFKNGIRAPKLNGKLICEKKLDTDVLKCYVND